MRRELVVTPFEGLLILPDVKIAHRIESYYIEAEKKYHLLPELVLEYYFKNS